MNQIKVSNLYIYPMILELIDNALREDIGDGDHSTLACVPAHAIGKAQLIIKRYC